MQFILEIEKNNLKFHMETQRPETVKTILNNKEILEEPLSQISSYTTELW